MIEKNLTTCKLCLEKKERAEDGKYGESRNKRWRDESGRLWRGRVCPDCHKTEMKSRMIAKRSKSPECEVL